jgi:hypothetical protein
MNAMNSSVLDVRNELLDRIATLQNSSLLDKLLYFLNEAEAETDSEAVFRTQNPAQIQAYQRMIDEGIADSDSGKVVDFEAVKEKWKQRFAHGK